MNPETPTGSSQPSVSSSSSSFQAQFPNQFQNHLPYFSATVKFPLTSPVPFQCVIGLQPLSPSFYQFCPSPTPGGYFSQDPTEPRNPFGSNSSVVIDLDKSSSPGGRDQNGCSNFNKLVEKCAFSHQKLDPLTKKCPVANSVCQGPKENQQIENNGGAEATTSLSCRKILNCGTQATDDVRAIAEVKNSSVQVISALKPVDKEPPKKSANDLVQGHKESNETMQIVDPHRMEKEPQKSRSPVVPKLLDIAEKDALNEAEKKSIFIRPRARGIFTVISGKSLEKDEEVVQFSGKLVDLTETEDKEADEPIKKKKKPGPKPKKRY